MKEIQQQPNKLVSSKVTAESAKTATSQVAWIQLLAKAAASSWKNRTASQ